MKLKILFFIVLYSVSAALLSSVAAVESPQSLVRNGLADLRGMDLSTGLVKLDGDWIFEGKIQKVPAALNFAKGPYGYGTYALRILTDAQVSGLALHIPMVGTSYRLRINGDILVQEGVPSPRASESKPSYRPRLVSLPQVNDGTYELSIEFANWHDQFSGIYFPLELGTLGHIETRRISAVLWESILFGTIFIMGLYHLGSFFFRSQNKAPLWFGIFCLLVALRSTLYSEIIFLQVFPDISWFFVIRTVYACMSLGLIAFMIFVHKLYPQCSNVKFVYAIVFLASLYALINIFAPIPLTTILLVPFQIVMLLGGLGALVVVINALRKREGGAVLFVVGTSVFLVTIILDIVKNHFFWQLPSLVNIGTIFFLLMQSLVVSRLFARAFASAEFQKVAVERINESLERFIPREVLGFLNKKNITEISLGDYVELNMTVFFLDIRDFTALSERMTPQENFRFINSFLRRFGPLIRKNNGFVDKYMGDGIMALFPGKPEDALTTALEMRHELADYNSGRLRGGYEAVRFGIGIHHGPLMLGTVGENMRMDSTVISDTVNVASRLEGLTKKYITDILVSGHTLEAVTVPDAINSAFVADETVKGKSRSIQVHRLL